MSHRSSITLVRWCAMFLMWLQVLAGQEWKVLQQFMKCTDIPTTLALCAQYIIWGIEWFG